MSKAESVFSVLIVSSSEKFHSAMAEMLPEKNFRPLVHVPTATAAQRAFAERSFDFVFVNSPLKDDVGVSFALDCSSLHGALVLFIAGSEIFADVSFKLSENGVFALQKPLSKQTLENSMRWMITAKNRINLLEKKTAKIEDKMDEIRLVNRAKWLLISNEGMLEPEAHRFLEKEAMNRCIPKAQLAKEVIEKYS